MTSRRAFALFGLLATIAGMAAGHLVASAIKQSASPVFAISSTVIELTPQPIASWAIRTFEDDDGFSFLFLSWGPYNYDKIVLVGSVMLGALALAAAAGVLAKRSFGLGLGILMGLVAVAALAVVFRPGFDVIDLVPSIVTALVGAVSFAWLVRTSAGVPVFDMATTRDRLVLTGETPATGGSTRRGVLIAGGVIVALSGVMATAGQYIATARSRIRDIAFPAAADPAPAFPEGLQGVDGITPLRVPREDFYRVDTRIDGGPLIDIDSWTLTIDGDVENELEFSFDDILEMDLIERDITLTCVSNSVGGRFVGGQRWLGVRLMDLLERAGIGDRADQLFSEDVDGMTISTPLSAVTDGRDAMLAIAMDGEPLPREHGYPARLVIPGLYGFISATKWVTRLTLTTYDEQQAYWTERDWDTDAPIKPSARIDTPDALAQLDAGEVVVGGVAWAQQRGGVQKVQVRIDGGAWEDAELGPEVSEDYWRQWAYRWQADEPGQHFIAARVLFGPNGDETQTAVEALPFPGGSSGIHEYFVTVT